MEMEFNVAQLMKEPVGAKRTYEFEAPHLPLSEALPGETGAVAAEDVRGPIRLTRLRNQIRAQGEATGRVTLLCSRCLEPFTTTVQAPLEELYRQTYDVVSGLPVPAGEADQDDDVFTIDRNHILDLREPVRQALLVALPMQPLCREDCRGLCPTCGSNRNLTSCDCVEEESDPRLAVLAHLLSEAAVADSTVS